MNWLDECNVNFEGLRVLVRSDLNTPLKTSEGSTEEGQKPGTQRYVADDFRIRASLATLEYLLERKARVTVVSHLGRPKGKVRESLSLAPVAEILQSHLRRELVFTDDCIGDGIKRLKARATKGSLLMGENLRFHSGETKNHSNFADRLAEDSDLFVFDAFGVAHREHASVTGLADRLPTVGGLLLKKETESLNKILSESITKSLTAVLGGSKVSDKISILSKLIDVADRILIGGAMAYTFLAAKGHDVGISRVERERIKLAESMLAQAEVKNTQILLPVDHIVAQDFAENAEPRIINNGEFEALDMGLDIGPKTLETYSKVLKQSELIFWNGPMGVFEWENFSKGTHGVAEAIAASKGYSVVGGGDSAAAVLEMDMARDFSHISTGGGASLAFLEGRGLPGLKILESELRGLPESELPLPMKQETPETSVS